MKPFVENMAEEAAILRQIDPSLAPDVHDLEGGSLGIEMREGPPVYRVAPSRLGRLALWVFTTLAGFVVSIVAWDFVAGLLNRNEILGMISLVLFGLAALVLLALALREVLAFTRFAQIDHLREDSARALASDDLKGAREASEAIAALYRTRPELAWGLARFDEAKGDVVDADAYLALAETELFAPLDAAATAEVEAAARRVAVITAMVPLALADVAVAAYSNVAMIRRIAAIYGGRSSLIGSLGLLRKIITSLVAAGVVSLADDLIGTVAGGGALSKLSRRLGEGVVNAGLTARVGLAAMEICRPLAFHALKRPSVGAVLKNAVTGVIPNTLPNAKEKPAKAAGDQGD